MNRLLFVIFFLLSAATGVFALLYWDALTGQQRQASAIAIMSAQLQHAPKAFGALSPTSVFFVPAGAHMSPDFLQSLRAASTAELHVYLPMSITAGAAAAAVSEGNAVTMSSPDASVDISNEAHAVIHALNTAEVHSTTDFLALAFPDLPPDPAQSIIFVRVPRSTLRTTTVSA